MSNSRSFWVTGASNGLGMALVEHLLLQGHRVAASDCPGAAPLHHDRFLQLPGLLQGAPEAAEAGQLLEQAWGALDCLIINAGTSDYLAGDIARDALFEHLIESNHLATQLSLAAAVPLLERGSAPQVMAVFSRYTALQMYAPTQVAAGWNNTVQWVREQRVALQAQGIDVTVVAPLAVDSQVTAAPVIPEAWTAETAAQELLKRLPERLPELVLEVLHPASLWPMPGK
ncbi:MULTISPECIES: SDR family oxidoreductase [Pseudomonas]|uniref:SDR family oxidoreductase n=1 Tax=Pseudomonas TaxID=286 RepID=UPI00048E400A|nr:MULTISPECIES: SDR family oxidoreductase [Pseudomonas]